MSGSAPSPQTRIVALDALRGLAVLGIALMNVIAFSMPTNAYINPAVWGGTGTLETSLWAASFVLVEDKFRALFAMMFGAGAAILLGKGQHPVRAHYARMAVLLLIGLVHATLLASNDVLRIYAVCGLLLSFVARWPVKRLVWAAVLLIAAQLAVSGWYAFGWLRYWHDHVSGVVVDPAGLEQAARAYGAHPDTMAAAMARGTEGFDERVARRLASLPAQAEYVLASLPSSLAAMLLGMAMWRSGLLAGTWSRIAALRLAERCMLASVPLLVFLAAWSILSGFAVIVTAANAIVWSAPFDILLGVTYAALAMALLRGGSGTRVLAAAGRMALTNYLATSLVFSIMFASWGFGLFGEVSRGQALLLTLVPIAFILLWSPWWLARFRQGPLEWLWRSAASGTLLPFRRRP